MELSLHCPEPQRSIIQKSREADLRLSPPIVWSFGDLSIEKHMEKERLLL